MKTPYITPGEIWVGWFGAIALPGTAMTVGLQLGGLPLGYAVAAQLFVAAIAVGVAHAHEYFAEQDQDARLAIEQRNSKDDDLLDEIDRELNARN